MFRCRRVPHVIRLGLAAIVQIAQTTLRKVVGRHRLDEMRAETDAINADVRKTLDVVTGAWGSAWTRAPRWPSPPLMSTINESGAFLVRETAGAATAVATGTTGLTAAGDRSTVVAG